MTPVKAAILAALTASAASAQQPPLSAIDWLDDIGSVPIAQPGSQEPAITSTAVTPDVDVMPLSDTHADAVGLLPTSTTGLPTNLWSSSKTGDLIDRIARIPPDPLPALQALYYTLLLAEADAPIDAGVQGAFLGARIEALTRFGAVDPARALIERAGPEDSALFDTWLDLSLLVGAEELPCRALREQPGLSRNYVARIYCTAVTGDWPTAALIYDTAESLDALSRTDATLLALFLDPEAIDETPIPAPPNNMSALTYRLFEAAGTLFPTSRLPRAFAMADLRKTSGWRAEIEAAERLTQTGALPANQLLGLYSDGKPAASGGVWDRVRAIQALDAALNAKDPTAVANTLPAAWSAMREKGLEIAFAQLFAAPLRTLELPPETREIAFLVNMLSDEYEAAKSILQEPDETQAFLIDLARGKPAMARAKTSHEQAVARGFLATEPSRDHARLIKQGKIGEAILAASNMLDRARGGNMADLSDALTTLRSLGLEDTARRAALQILILGAA